MRMEDGVVGHVETLRSLVGSVPRLGRLKDMVWRWLETHWSVVSVAISTAVAALLLVTSTLPPPLAPFVLGPLVTVVVTAVVAPRGAVGHPGRSGRGRGRRPV